MWSTVSLSPFRISQALQYTLVFYKYFSMSEKTTMYFFFGQLNNQKPLFFPTLVLVSEMIVSSNLQTKSELKGIYRITTTMTTTLRFKKARFFGCCTLKKRVIH